MKCAKEEAEEDLVIDCFTKVTALYEKEKLHE
jgi:hypothetical protein